MSNLPAIIQEVGLTAPQYQVLKDAIYPGASDAGIALAVNYCKARNLDVMKKPVHIVAIWNSELKRKVEGLWPSISEARITASRTGAYAGSSEPEYGDDITQDFHFYDFDTKQTITKPLTFPKWCKVTVFKIVKGNRCEFTAKVFWLEEYAATKSKAPNEMWAGRPYGQIAKVAEAAALRKGFPEELGGIHTKEEIENPEEPMVDVTPPKETKIEALVKAETEEPAPEIEFYDLDGVTTLTRTKEDGCRMLYDVMKTLEQEKRTQLYYLNREPIDSYAKENTRFRTALKKLGVDAA